MKHFNMAGDYGPLLRRCVAEKLWIRESKIWWGPYDWAEQYAHTWIQSVDKPTLADPFQLLREALLLIEQNATPAKIARYHAFHQRVLEYYLAGKDAKLLKSMETKIWIL